MRSESELNLRFRGRSRLKACLLAGMLMAALVGPALLAQAPRLGASRMSRAVLLDKIRGGWAGQMIGVAYGAPTEFHAQGKILEEPLSWTPERIENALHQDDLYVEMTFAKVMDEAGLGASTEQYAEAFKQSQYELWHANAAARRNLNRGINAPLSGHPRYNIHASDIDFQIEADFIGLMAPGLPQTAQRYCERVGRIMSYGDGLYGGMFVAGMYAAAYFQNDPRRVVEAGLAGLPPGSTYARVIGDVLAGSALNPSDWKKTWQLIEEKWDREAPCPEGALSPFNIDAKLNGAYVALGLIYGQRDFLKTMEIATRCGQDSDCNPSTAAGVLGVMLGFSQIPDLCKSGLAKLADNKFEFTDYSFNSIVKSTENRALLLIREAGGKVTETEVTVPFQALKPPKQDHWDPGIPDQKLAVSDPAWTWGENWAEVDGGKKATGAGSEVNLKFKGVAVALLGVLDQEGGRADVYVDGRKSKLPLDAYVGERTHDQVLWHIYGLRAGEHTLHLVTRDDADAHSKGKKIVLERAVIYRGHVVASP